MPNGRPGRRGADSTQAKDFMGSLKRLFGELKNYRGLVYLGLILAMLSSILSIFAPNKLSDLTDEIQAGLVVNSSNFTTLSSEVTTSFTNEIEKFLNIQYSGDASSEEIDYSSLSTDTLSLILSDSIYKGIYVTKEEKIEFLENIDNEIILSDELKNVFLDSITIDGTTISSTDQIEFLNILSGIDTTSSTEIYAAIDEMPEAIKFVIEPYMDMDEILNIVIFLVILYLLSAIFSYLESFIMTHVANKFAYELRDRISKKINSLPLKYFDLHQSGDVLSRVTNDVDTIAQSLNQSLSSFVSAITLFLGTIIMMFVTNAVLAITAILASLFGFIFMFVVLSKSQKYFVTRQVELGNLNGHIEEVYSGLNVVKAYNGTHESNKKFDELNEKVFDANRKSEFLSGLMMPMMSFIGNFAYVAVCVVGAVLTMNGTISFGVIIAFITYVRMFTSPLSQIAQAATSFQSTAAASERVFEFLDEEEMANEDALEKSLAKNDALGNIEFKNVSFQYAGNDKPTIYDFSANIKSGQKVAIVGPTGAGKTTMVNLLMKFYDINDGDIIIDGISIKDLKRDNVHRLFTMVLQDTWLFEGTVKENIIYNRDNITDEEVDEVCKVVGLDHFIKTLSDGYDTIIADNDSVSAGQRQLLTIARGMLEDAPFLILDEATSNVDTRTEELVQKAMDKLTEGKTSFIIAHRLSTIKNADLILVMKDGNVIETGNHEQLMKQNGFYADLYNSQFEG